MHVPLHGKILSLLKIITEQPSNSWSMIDDDQEEVEWTRIFEIALSSQSKL